MSKVIDSLIQSEIDTKDYAAVMLAKFDFSSDTPHFGPLRFTNAYQSVYWDEAGAGEELYIGLGEFAEVQAIPETNELSSVTMSFTLSGIPNNLVTGIFDRSAYQNRPCYVWYALVDKQTYAIQGGQTGPILVFAGLMDYATFEFGSTATISLVASSRLADWERPRGGRYNDAHQRTYVDPTDSGFKYVKPLQAKEIRFGGRTAADPGGGDWANTFGGNSRPDNDPREPNPGCFVAGTLITMADGNKIPIEDIGPGDAIRGSEGYNIVQLAHNYQYNGKLYSINGSDHFVTGCHPFKTSKGWKAFNLEEAQDANPNLEISTLEIDNILHKDNDEVELLETTSDVPSNGIQVYNFTVSGTEDFYANDYLVHNIQKYLQ